MDTGGRWTVWPWFNRVNGVHMQRQLSLLPQGAEASSPVGLYLSRLAPGSRTTLRSRLREVAQLASHGTHTELTLDWAAVSYADLTAIRERLRALHGYATVNLAIVATRGVLKQAWQMGALSAEEYHRRLGALTCIRGTSLPSGRALTTAEVRRLFRVCDDSPKGVRDKAIFALLMTGMRHNELHQLDLADWKSDGTVSIRKGKGGHQRLGYLADPILIAYVNDYITRRGSTAGPLFFPVTRASRYNKARRLGYASVAAIVRWRCAEAGVLRCACHDWRRTVASWLIERGVDLDSTSKVLGHSSVTTTALYVKNAERRKKAAMTRLTIF